MAISFAKAYIKHFYEIPFYCARSKEDSKVFILNYLCQHELDEKLPELVPRSARCGLMSALGAGMALRMGQRQLTRSINTDIAT